MKLMQERTSDAATLPSRVDVEPVELRLWSLAVIVEVADDAIALAGDEEMRVVLRGAERDAGGESFDRYVCSTTDAAISGLMIESCTARNATLPIAPICGASATSAVLIVSTSCGGLPYRGTG
jgi:hypothetical protein